MTNFECTPSLDEFKALAEKHRVIPVTTTVMVDHLTAVGLFHTLCEERAGTFLFESAEAGVQWSRYSFVGVRCAAMLTESNGAAAWSGRTPEGIPHQGQGLEVLRSTLDMLQTSVLRPDLPPLTGGMVGYVSYDIVRDWENIGDLNPDVVGIPRIGFLLATDMAVIDHLSGTVTFIANAINYDNSPERVDEAYADAVARLDHMLHQVSSVSPAGSIVLPTEIQVSVEAEPDFLGKVERIQEYIRAGDAFQVVLSQRFEVACKASGLQVYRMLRSTNPSPYMYIMRMPDPHDFDRTAFEIVGSSPEALVTVADRHCTVNPIAGTRRRSSDPETDRALAEEMLADLKERAEHLMLVDLGRNDLGRVCDPGSVRVRDFMHVERYSHVMHIVSTVTGTLQDKYTALDALRATFPAGTLSGAPKPRAMQIIEELENSRRGLYGGCIGYFDFAGNMDMAIAIRTALIKDHRAYVQAGAGIVADSIAQSESDECVNKALAVLRAIALANTAIEIQ